MMLMLRRAALVLVVPWLVGWAPSEKAVSDKAEETKVSAQTVYDFKVKDIDGKEVALSKYKGDVLLIVNVASQ